MRRWVWRVLLIAAAALALTGSALAAEGDEVTLENGLIIKEITGGKWEVQGFARDYTGSRDPLVIPSSYGRTGANNVTSIAAEAFKGSSNGKGVTTVVIPVSITTIGESAFEACPDLETVVFMEHKKSSTDKLTIEEKAFLGCRNLSNLILSRGLGTIKPQAFGANQNLTEVVIPDGVEKIEERAFAQCANLKTVYIPVSLKPAAGAATKPIIATTFSGTGLELFHYGCDPGKEAEIKNILDLPAGMTAWKNVHAAVDDRMITEPSCLDEGHVYGGVSCRAPLADQTGVCKSFAKTIDIPALGHDLQTPPTADFDAEAAKHKDCEDWTWEYEATCSRCGVKEPRKKEIAGDPTKHNWVDDGEPTIKAPTCLEAGKKTTAQKCSKCGQAGDPKVEVLPKLTTHTYTGGKTEVYEILPPLCNVNLKCPIATFKVCDFCGKTNACAECERLRKELEDAKKDGALSFDAIISYAQLLEDHLLANHADKTSDAYVEVTYYEKPDHTPPEPTEENTVSIKEATCTEGGEIVYKPDTACTVCGGPLPEDDLKVTSEKLGHDWYDLGASDKDVFEKEATCTEQGVKRKNAQKCARCGEVKAEDTEIVPALGHQWGSPVLDEGAPYKPATCTEPGEGTGTITCTREGCHSDPKDPKSPPASQTGKLTLPALGHDWGEWKNTKEPTATESGTQERVCQREGCGEKETRTLPPLGTPDKPDDPDNPDNPDDPDKPTTKPEDKTYKVDVVQASNGVTTVSRSAAKQGDLVTVTVSPSSGYVLDMIRVISSSQALNLTDLGGGQYRFTMPAADVEVRATYDKTGADYGSNWSEGFGNSGNGKRTDPRRTTDSLPAQIQEQPAPQAVTDQRMFSDVPTYHWAAAQINWASQMGYMSGSGGRFDPDGLITAQQMWMVLARLTGSNPATMTEARRWAELGGYADGSSPTGPVKRHQLVTALYRCARLTGRTGRVPASLSGFPDSRTVPTVAREAFTWALSRGVVNTDSEGRIKPNENLTRAQFAVILYSYSYT